MGADTNAPTKQYSSGNTITKSPLKDTVKSNSITTLRDKPVKPAP